MIELVRYRPTIRPFASPTAAPAARAMSTVRIVRGRSVGDIFSVMMAARPIMEPTERSKVPAIMAKVMPTAMIPIMEAFRRMLVMFRKVRNCGNRIENSAEKASSMIQGTLSLMTALM